MTTRRSGSLLRRQVAVDDAAWDESSGALLPHPSQEWWRARVNAGPRRSTRRGPDLHECAGQGLIPAGAPGGVRTRWETVYTGRSLVLREEIGLGDGARRVRHNVAKSEAAAGASASSSLCSSTLSGQAGRSPQAPVPSTPRRQAPNQRPDPTTRAATTEHGSSEAPREPGIAETGPTETETVRSTRTRPTVASRLDTRVPGARRALRPLRRAP